MTWRSAGLTDVGKIRQSNQDAFALVDALQLWVIADGMGGHTGGDVASRLAVEAIETYVRKHAIENTGTTHQGGAAGAVLCDAIVAANQVIQEQAQKGRSLAGMGTTVVALHITSFPAFQATIAHVGDSRAYLLRGGTISLLSRDHSLMEERIQLGLLTREEATNHPLRHVLSRAVGIDEQVEPDASSLSLQPDDVILLCTDGLTKMLHDDEILTTVSRSQSSLEETCHALVNEANRCSGEDNTTVVLVGFRP